MSLPPHKTTFLRASLSSGALRFGTFELKSGRISPYFFNAGDFYRADLLAALASAYAETIHQAFPAPCPGSPTPTTTTPDDADDADHHRRFDIIFGPAYKGIPLATAATLALHLQHPARYADLQYSFDRKEAKAHGEGGSIVGAPLRGRRVLIIDDVVSAGTAKRQAVEKIRAEGGEVVGIVVAVDRQETLPSVAGLDGVADERDGGGGGDQGDGGRRCSAIGELRKEFGIPIVAILTLDDIVAGVKETGLVGDEELGRVERYRAEYGASD